MRTVGTGATEADTMQIRNDAPGDEVGVIHRWEHGLTWIPHPDTHMQRASHALVDHDDVWLVDPLDASGLDEELDALGTVAGVVVLKNHHGRHADRIAERHNVAIHVPACLPEDSHPVSGFEAPVEVFDEELADTGFDLVWETASSVLNEPWREGALYHPDRRTLVIPDMLQTAWLTGQDGHLKVVPYFHFSPPRGGLGDLPVERILVGHGKPVTDNAQPALDAALAGVHGSAVGAILRVARFLPQYIYLELRS